MKKRICFAIAIMGYYGALIGAVVLFGFRAGALMILASCCAAGGAKLMENKDARQTLPMGKVSSYIQRLEMQRDVLMEKVDEVGELCDFCKHVDEPGENCAENFDCGTCQISGDCICEKCIRGGCSAGFEWRGEV